ncbi:MAG TPA: AMP-binding protein [Acidimicrobiales bacterium]|nr:AMP-binding protein [Acidimicrobiales bacterium]
MVSTGTPGPGVVPPSIPAVVAGMAARVPDVEAVVSRDGRYTFGSLATAAAVAAERLAGEGVAAGTRVAGSADNTADLVVAFLAAMSLGAVWVGLNRRLAPPEKAYILADSGAAVLVAPDDTVAELAPRRAGLPDLRATVPVAGLGAVGGPGGGSGHTSGGGHATLPDPDAVDPFAAAAIAYTSGTTGHPKGVVHSQHNLLLPGAYLASTDEYPASIRIGVCMPLTILNLMVLGPLLGLQAAATTVVLDRIDTDGLTDWVAREGIETMAVPPATLFDLAHRGDPDGRLASWTRVQTGGGDCPDALLEQFERTLAKEVTRSYGLTEAPTLVSVEDRGRPHLSGASGRVLPYLDVAAADPSGRSLPPGTEGELCIRAAADGPWAGVWTPMLGYWGRPEDTARVLVDGVLHTGDMGSVDADGNVSVKDRRSNVIVRGGANVYPAEVERVLQAHPAVAASAVVGRPDPRLGRRVVAYVELVEPVDADDLRVHCAAELARYKVPEEIVVMDHLPRNAMGKVLRQQLAEETAGGQTTGEETAGEETAGEETAGPAVAS